MCNAFSCILKLSLKNSLITPSMKRITHQEQSSAIDCTVSEPTIPKRLNN